MVNTQWVLAIAFLIFPVFRFQRQHYEPSRRKPENLRLTALGAYLYLPLLEYPSQILCWPLNSIVNCCLSDFPRPQCSVANPGNTSGSRKVHESPWDSWLCTSELHKNMILLADLLSILSSLMFSLPFIYLCHPLAAPSTAFSSLVSCPPLFLLPLAQSPKRVQAFLTWTLSPTCSLQNTCPPVSRPCLCLICHTPFCPSLYSSLFLNEGITYSAVLTSGRLTFFVGEEGFGSLIALCWE